MKYFDFIIIGGGIAGVAVGAELIKRGSVLVMERETCLAYHTTGRSAAISMESYGNSLIRRLTSESCDFYRSSIDNNLDQPLCSPRGALIVSDECNLEKLRTRYHTVYEHTPSIEWLDTHSIASMAPFLSSKWICGIYEPGAFDRKRSLRGVLFSS